jgi:hypothetical protein
MAELSKMVFYIIEDFKKPFLFGEICAGDYLYVVNIGCALEEMSA